MFSPPKSKGWSGWTGGCGPGRGAGGPAIGRWSRLDRGSAVPGVGPGAGVPVVRTLRVVGAFPVPRGAAPRGPACPAGSPFLPRNGEKEGRGQAPWTPGFMARLLPLARFGVCVTLSRSWGYFAAHLRTLIWGPSFIKCFFSIFFRKMRPKSVLAYRRKQPLERIRDNNPPKRASGNERALKKGGAGGIPPRLFASGLSLEKAWIPAPDRGGGPPVGHRLRQSQTVPRTDYHLYPFLTRVLAFLTATRSSFFFRRMPA